MSVAVDISTYVQKLPTHGWNKRLAQIAVSAGFHVVEISQLSVDTDFICINCHSDSEHCNCSISNPHTALNIFYMTMNTEVRGCDCEFICKCNTVDVV